MARKKGSINKDTRELLEMALDEGVDPFVILLRFANRNWRALGYKSEKIAKQTPSGEIIEVDVISPELQAQCADKANQYIRAKKKYVEVEGHGGGLLEELKDMPPDQRQELIELYVGKLRTKKPPTD